MLRSGGTFRTEEPPPASARTKDRVQPAMFGIFAAANRASGGQTSAEAARARAGVRLVFARPSPMAFIPEPGERRRTTTTPIIIPWR